MCRNVDIRCEYVCAACKECTDNVTFSPMKKCVQQNTDFTCLATHGHPGEPSYTWTRLPSGTPQAGSTYQLSELGEHTISCDAKYAHTYCPEQYAVCSVNHTVTVFGQYILTLQHVIFLLSDNGFGWRYQTPEVLRIMKYFAAGINMT